MPIVAADIKQRLSGGTSNTDPNDSLGGAKSSTEITDDTLNNLFDDVSGAESNNGDTEYRCFYVHNGHASLTLLSAKIWIDTNTPAGDSVEIGLGTSAIGGTEQTIANENTAPTGVSFSSAAGEANALSIGDIPAGSHKAIWVKRIVPTSTSAADNNSYVLKISGETAQ